jgi:hypothetical protein
LNLGSLGSKNPGRLARPGFLVFIVGVAADAHELKARAPIDQADAGKIVEYLRDVLRQGSCVAADILTVMPAANRPA